MCREVVCCNLVLGQDSVAYLNSHSFVQSPSPSLCAVNAIRNPNYVGGMDWGAKMVSGSKSVHRIQPVAALDGGDIWNEAEREF